MQRLYLELSDICNLKCSFCPITGKEKKIMPVEDVLAIYDRYSDRFESIMFHLLGEPLAYPHLPILLAHVKKPKIVLTTNGLLLDKYQSEILNCPGIKQINFSLQSLTDHYDLTKVNAIVDRLILFAFKAEQIRPDLYINFRLWNTKEKTITDPLFTFINERFDVFINDHIDVRFKKSKKIRHRIYWHFDTRFEWPSLENQVYSTTGTCHGLQQQVAIHANGMVSPCCLDKDNIIQLGNIKKESLDDILKSPRATDMLAGFKKGQLVEELCQKCQYRTRF